MPSWIPGEDHLINFQKGDPYTKVDEGYAPAGRRLVSISSTPSPSPGRT